VSIPQEWIPVVSGAVGASGAVAAQIIAGVAASRREARAAGERRRDARASAFANEKRELFVKVLKGVDDQLTKYDEFWKQLEAEAEVSMPTGVLDPAQWRSFAVEVDLLAAPEVVRAINLCLLAFEDLDVATALRDVGDRAEMAEAVRARRSDLRAAMRSSLHSVPEERPGRARRAWAAIRDGVAEARRSRQAKRTATEADGSGT